MSPCPRAMTPSAPPLGVPALYSSAPNVLSPISAILYHSALLTFPLYTILCHTIPYYAIPVLFHTMPYYSIIRMFSIYGIVWHTIYYAILFHIRETVFRGYHEIHFRDVLFFFFDSVTRPICGTVEEIGYEYTN